MEKIYTAKKKSFDKGRNGSKDGEEWDPQIALQPDLQKDQQDFFQVPEQLTVRSVRSLSSSSLSLGQALADRKSYTDRSQI